MNLPTELFRPTERVVVTDLQDPVVRLLDALERSLHGDISPDEIVALLKEWGR